MLDWVMIKGDNEYWGEAIRSTELAGLLIASLPEIQTPPRRVQIDQVDGRAGDSITDLGYSAYDKRLGIGLYANYDVQNILDFFKMSGQIVFSNEPNKYYNYEIVNAIQLERVIRFKKGTVTLHVQPYKYAVTELPLAITSSDTDIINWGNVPSAPIYKIYGSGDIILKLDDMQVVTISLGTDEYVVLDIEKLEAYKDGVLKNRQVLGNYEKMMLKTGRNKISWEGNVSRIEVSKFSRWK